MLIYAKFELQRFRVSFIQNLSYKNYLTQRKFDHKSPQYILLIIWNRDRSLVITKQFDRGRYNYEDRPESNTLNNQMTTMQMHFKTFSLLVILVYILNCLSFYVQFLLTIIQPQLYYR